MDTMHNGKGLKVVDDDVNDYIDLLDSYEIELSNEEQKDLDELNALLKNRQQQENLATNIWTTIKQAAMDSVEQMIALDDRADGRPDKGAVITTPLNFRNGVVASEADKERYRMWQNRKNGNDISASDFRDDYQRFKKSYNEAKEKFKNERRNSDGSYNNDYNNTVVYDSNDPRAYHQPDSSGDMRKDTTKALNVDHVNSVKYLYEDDKVALYGGKTPEEFDQTMRDVANNQHNFAASDEHANKSMQDRDTLETAVNSPELNMDPEKVKAKQAEADKAKNSYLLRNAIGEKGKELVVGIGNSTVRATGKMLVGKAIKIAISEIYIEFSRKSKDSLIERTKRLVYNIIERGRHELSHIWQEIKEYATNNALSEIINLILNYFESTVKNIFKLIRCLFGSIIKAFKIILDSSRPWEERLFEALKIISAGIAMATGAMLNELIESAITTHLPFLTPIAGDISAVVSGLISSILSALVLMSFDRYKASLRIKNEEYRIQLLNMRLVGNETAHSLITSAKASVVVAQTTDLVRQEMSAIIAYDKEIVEYNKEIENSIRRHNQLNREISMQLQDIANTQDTQREERESANNQIDELLNKLTEIQ